MAGRVGMGGADSCSRLLRGDEGIAAGELRGMFSCEELHEERERWVWASAWVGSDKAALRAEWGMSEQDFRARYDGFLREM